MKQKVFLGWVLLSYCSVSFAYIDPGTGAYMVQAIIALISGIAFYFRHPIEFIKYLIKSIKKRNDE